MLRFLDSFLSLSHISFAPSWQSVRAVTVQLWKSSQYLARNRTKRKKQVDFGRGEDPVLHPCASSPPPPPLPRGLRKPLRETPPTSSPHAQRRGRARLAFSRPRPTLEADVRGQRPPPAASGFSFPLPGGDPAAGSRAAPAAPRWHLGLRRQIARPPRGKLGKQC